MDDNQLLSVLQQAGFKGEALRTAWALAKRESGGNPEAFNGNTSTGDQSYGLFQINMLGNMGPARRAAYGLKSNTDLLNPVINARVAYQMSHGGTDFGAWGLGPNAYAGAPAAAKAAYERYYSQYPGAVSGAAGTPSPVSGIPGSPVVIPGGGLGPALTQPKVPALQPTDFLPQGPSLTTQNLLSGGSPLSVAQQNSQRAQRDMGLISNQMKLLQSQQQQSQPVVASSAQPTTGGKTQADPYSPQTIPVKGLLNGNAPMVTGNMAINKMYPNLRVSSNVDWNHVNPRLLQAMQSIAEKKGLVIVINSGYRSNDYSAKVGGFAGDPHSKGIAVDAYVNGHPVGDVISPEDWAKYGVRSGNTPGFYKGKTDPEHLDLVGIPVKGGQ